MSKYDFVLDSMKFSYSSVTNFITCPYQFKLTYINCEERNKNFYSDFGLLTHIILEKYFKGELDTIELSNFYKDNYSKIVISPPPPYPAGMAERYYADGLEFFDNFEFNKEDYEILSIENEIKTVYNNIKLVLKPDLVLKEKKSGLVYLIDYKTSTPYKNNKWDKKKLEEYHKQMYLYAYFINHTTNIKINKIKLWFVRINKFDEFDYVEEDAGNVINWLFLKVLDIQAEEEFPPCDIEKNKFFCSVLCSMMPYCKYYQEFVNKSNLDKNK
jgi:CRISPR/Cas system-associated exonuclease Cas4 (RecB family)